MTNSTIQLYSFADFDRSSRVRWLLCELDLNFEEIRLDYKRGEQYTEQYRSINPVSRVPAVSVDGQLIFESGAIFSYFLDKIPNHNLIPTNERLYCQYLSWFFFACSEFDSKVAAPMRLYVRGYEPTEIHQQFELAKPLLATLSEHLSNHQYMIGNNFSAVDIFIASQLGLLNKANLLGELPALLQYIQRLRQRPAAVKSGVFDAMICRNLTGNAHQHVHDD